MQIEEGLVLGDWENGVVGPALCNDAADEVPGAAGQDADSLPGVLLRHFEQDICKGRRNAAFDSSTLVASC